jgi:hypothetical protein
MDNRKKSIFSPIEPIYQFWNGEREIVVAPDINNQDKLIKISQKPEFTFLNINLCNCYVNNCSGHGFILNEAYYPKCSNCRRDLSDRIKVEPYQRVL